MVQISRMAGIALVAVAVAAGPATQAQAEGLKLGALMPMTGGLQAYGGASLNGVKLAVDEMNAAGGVNGGKVTLSVGDTQTSPQAGVDAAKRLVSVEKVQAVIGALSSGVTIPISSSVTSKSGVPQISSASTSPVITGLADNDFLFRTVPTDAVQGLALAQVAAEKNLKSVSIIYVNNDYGKGLAETFAKNFKGKVAASIGYEEKQASYRGELQKAAKGKPERLLLIAYPEDGISILKQSLEGGFFDKFIFTDGMKHEKLIEAIGAKFLNGTYATAPESKSAAQDDFRKMYEKKYGELPPRPFIDSAYDATILAGLAAVKAGKNDPKAIRDALRSVANPPGKQLGPGQFAEAVKAIKAGQDIDYVGASGPQNFDKNGDVAGTYGHWEVEGGKIVTKRVFEPK